MDVLKVAHGAHNWNDKTMMDEVIGRYRKM